MLMFKKYFEKRERKKDQTIVAFDYRIIKTAYKEINPFSRKHMTEAFAKVVRDYVKRWGWDNFIQWYVHRYIAFVDERLNDYFYL